MSSGRNDPCPCGSGKKFKKCHGVSALTMQPNDPRQAQADALQRLDGDLEARLIRFGEKRSGAKWMKRAVADYLGSEEEQLVQEEMQLAVPWMFYHYVESPTYRPVARDMRVAQDDKLPADIRDLLDAQLEAWMSIWDVQRVTPGVGMQLKDLLTGHECFVYERSATQTLVEHDVVLGRVATCHDIAILVGLFPRALPPMAAFVVATEMRKLCRVRTRPVAKEKLRDADLLASMITMWVNEIVMLDRPKAMPSMQNTDGDPLEMTTDHFTIGATHVEDVVVLLGELPGYEVDEGHEDIAFVVTRPGNPMHPTWHNTMIGSVVITERKLTILTNSARRADALCAELKATLGKRVTYQLRDQSSVPHDLEAARATMGKFKKYGTSGVAEGPPPELKAIVRKFKEDHYRDWVNHAIPALGGLSPLVAAKSPKARAQLEALLRDLERSEARLPEEERFDFQILRRQLGFE